jgi:hypothetical protein
MFIVTNTQATDLAPLGAKPASGTIGEHAKAIALLRSFGLKKGPQGYKHLAPLGRSAKQCSVAFRNEKFNDPRAYQLLTWLTTDYYY